MAIVRGTTEAIIPGLIHWVKVTEPIFLLSIIPTATIFAVLPIIVRLPKNVPPNKAPHHKGNVESPISLRSRIMGMKVAIAKTLSIKALKKPDITVRGKNMRVVSNPKVNRIFIARNAVTPVNFKVPTEAKKSKKKDKVHQSTLTSTISFALCRFSTNAKPPAPKAVPKSIVFVGRPSNCSM